MKYGDTLTAPPVVSLATPFKIPFLIPDQFAYNYLYAPPVPGLGALQFTSVKDSALQYIVLYEHDSNSTLVLPARYINKIGQLLPGNYSLLLVTKHNNTATLSHLQIKANGTVCANMKGLSFLSDDPLLMRLFRETDSLLLSKKSGFMLNDSNKAEVLPAFNSATATSFNGGPVSGNIHDEKGNNPVQFCTVGIIGYSNATTSDAAGNFNLGNIRPGKYVLRFSSLGYDSRDVEVSIVNKAAIVLRVKLTLGMQQLSQVVVTAYGTVRQARELGYSTANVSNAHVPSVNLQNGLQGKVAGLNTSTSNAGLFNNTRITLRGIRTLTGNNGALVILNGIIIPMNELSQVNEAEIIDVTIVNATEALLTYGAAGANGAILITTNPNKALRKDFRDYAFWEPNFQTDKNGDARFNVTYPDNVTGWNSIVFGMDKKARSGSASVFTKAFKPMIAQLNLPQFLVQGDSSMFISKAINYTDNAYTINTTFMLRGNEISKLQQELLPHASNIGEQMITAVTSDSIHASFALESTTGYRDGEERKIPVFKKGIEETIGMFSIMENDSSISFAASPLCKALNIYAANNALDLLLDELKHLREYPYACMEQVTSKMAGMDMEKSIFTLLKKPFRDQRQIDKLLKKLQKSQRYDGGWPWWENGKSNLQITNYIISTLLDHDENQLLETNIRNGLEYLYNQLNVGERYDELSILSTLSKGNYTMDYKFPDEEDQVRFSL